MSKISDKVYNILISLFPFDKIYKEYYIYFNDNKLFFDFYIKHLDLFVEVQGKQHYYYVEHFHDDIVGFNRYKFRDSLKKEYCTINNKGIVYIRYDDDIDKNNIIYKIKSELCIHE